MDLSLGESGVGGRGFPQVIFHDAHGCECSVQCSSAIDDSQRGMENPGTSFLWIGVNDPDPRIMASKAVSLGIHTAEVAGWIPFPVPDCVLMSTRMHLNREQVSGLIVRLREWLDTGKFA